MILTKGEAQQQIYDLKTKNESEQAYFIQQFDQLQVYIGFFKNNNFHNI